MKNLLFLTIITIVLFASCETLTPEKPKDKGEKTENHIEIPVDSISYIYRDGTSVRPYLPSDFAFGGAFSTFLQKNQIYLSDTWVEGYIVGYVNGSKMTSIILSSGDKETNVVIANSTDETNISQMLPIQLSKSSVASQAIRDAVNLKQNPENLHKKVKLQGEITTYMSVWGIKNVTDYVLEK